MPGPNWQDDPDTPQLAANIRELIGEVVASAKAREMPSLQMAQGWHARMHQNVEVPRDSYVGNFRGDTTIPDLIDYEAHVHGIRGAPAMLVFGEVLRLIGWLNDQVVVLDDRKDAVADDDDVELLSLHVEALRIAAYMHGEWVRVHPFANGNGRTARLWVTWVSARYDMPPLLPIRPRPQDPYGSASDASMAGDHEPMRNLLFTRYETG